MMKIACLAVSIALSLPQSPSFAQLVKIGSAAAVRGTVNASAPGAIGRIVSSGKPLFHKDHVTTDDAARLQVLLVDETTFTIGPNSDMVLDEFVYDPKTDAGKVTAKVTKGVFRFVTGKVARKSPASMNVNMPVGTIGIRGTMVAGRATAEESVVILLGPGDQNNADESIGSVEVANAGGEVTLRRPGWGTTIKRGQPPAPPRDMTEEAARIAAALEPKPDKGSQKESGKDPSEEAGDDTARARRYLAGALEDFKENGEALKASQDAAEFVAGGISTWDQIRRLESGTGQYSGTGSYVCVAFPCSGPGGTLSVSLLIDFGARTFGGGGASSSLSMTGSVTATDNINLTSFSSLSGNATHTLSGANHTNTAFNGTTLTFKNSEGVIANEVAVNLQWDGSLTVGPEATGSANAQR